MQYLIRIISDESEDFRRDILINEDATFLDLNNVILLHFFTLSSFPYDFSSCPHSSRRRHW